MVVSYTFVGEQGQSARFCVIDLNTVGVKWGDTLVPNVSFVGTGVAFLPFMKKTESATNFFNIHKEFIIAPFFFAPLQKKPSFT